MTDAIIVEDNTIVQDRIQDLLRKSREFNIVGAYFTLKAAMSGTPKSKPQLVILDLKLPDVRGTEGLEGMRQKYPDARIAIYTAYENETEILDCMMAGANGYILKDTPDDRLPGELQVIAQGGSTLTPRVAEKLLKMMATPKTEESALSKREIEVLNYISLGLKYEHIAEELGISAHTVRHHLEKIFKKLNVTSRTQAVAQAVRSGIIRMR